MTEHNEVNSTMVQADENELVITHTFEAPRDIVVKAWTEPDHLKHWWGAKGFTLHIAGFDFRPGGLFHYSQTSPEGHEMWGKFVYREIDVPDRLSFTSSFSDKEGNTVRALFSQTWPLEILNTLTFSEDNGNTTLTMRGAPLHATEEEQAAFRAMHDGIRQGFAGTFGQLADYLVKL